MAIAVPAAGGVSVAAMLSVGLLAIATSLVLFGLLKGYDATLGALLHTLSSRIRGVRFVGGKIADVLDDIDDTVRDSIGRAALYFEHKSAQFFHGAAWLWEATIDTTVDLARATADAIGGIIGGEIPQQITERTRTIHDELSKTNAWAKARERALARQWAHGIDRLQRDARADRLAAQRGIDAIDARIEARFEGIEAGIGEAFAGVRSWAGARLGALDGRMTGVLSIVGAGALTAAAVRALDMRFPFYKCSNVQRFNRALCRGNPDLLMGLAALTGLALVAVDPRVVARTGQEVVGIMDELLHDLADIV